MSGFDEYATVEELLDIDRINDIIKKALRTFEKIFPLSYKNSLLDNIMTRGKVQPENSYILPHAPIATTPLKAGILNKRGGKMKNWKKRYFIALNAGDNFCISYGKSAQLKDEIYRFTCCGYHCELFNEEEAEKFGEFGIKLVPYSESKSVKCRRTC